MLSPRVPDASYWLALSYWKQSHKAPYDQDPTLRAMAQFDRFLGLYPDHPKAQEIQTVRLEARARLAEKAVRNGKLYLKQKHFGPARYYFEKARREYPESLWAQRALPGQAEAMMALGLLDDARLTLEDGLPKVTDAESRRDIEELLKKLGPARSAGGPG